MSSRVGGCNWQKENMKAQDRLARMRHNGPDDRPLSSVGSAGWDAKGRGSEEVLSLLPRFEQAKRRVLHLWNELKLPRREHKFFMAQFFKPVSYANLNQINAQISRLLEHRMVTLAVLEPIEIREGYMNELRNLCRLYTDVPHMRFGKEEREHHKQRTEELMTWLVQVTLEVIEAIALWREGLTRPAPFVYRNENYVQKILADMQWLKTCELVLAQGYANVRCPNLLPPSLIVLDDADSATPDAERGFSVNMSTADAQRLAAAEKLVVSEHETQKNLAHELRALHIQSFFIPTLRHWFKESTSEPRRPAPTIPIPNRAVFQGTSTTNTLQTQPVCIYYGCWLL